MTEQAGAQHAAVQETLAQFEAWCAANDDTGLHASAAATVLADLFARAQRASGDLSQPTAELLRWLARDLARDGAVDRYDEAIATLTRYLFYLRTHQLWRRSARAVSDCWDALTVMSRMPAALPTLGSLVDETIARTLADRPAPEDVLAVGVTRGFVAPLRATLDALATEGRLSHQQVADLIDVAPDSVDLHVWLEALTGAALVTDDGAYLEPTPEARAVGGCPAPSGTFVERVVSELVTAALTKALSADVDADRLTFPHGMPLMVVLAASTDATYYLPDPDDPDDTEEGTAASVQIVVEQAVPGDANATRFADEVLALLAALTRFGVFDEIRLPEGSLALLAPAPLRHAVIRALADVTGCVGTPDDTVVWHPVDLPFAMAADTGFDLQVTLDDPHVVRRVRVLGSVPLTDLHAELQRSLRWRNQRDVAFSDTTGIRRFAPVQVLPQLSSDSDRQVTDITGVRLGSVLRAAGDEIVYQYGNLDRPWQLRIRAERVMSGMQEPVTWLDSAGEAPQEPTVLWEALRRRMPPAMQIPDELERAWLFLEDRGWSQTSADGDPVLSPTGRADSGVVFTSGLPVGEGQPFADRLVPIACSPDGTTIQLWLDDEGATRVVAIRPDGAGAFVGDGAVDLLRLVAIGYADLAPHTLGRPPQPPIDDIAPFQHWVRTALGTDVPDLWGHLGPDEFTAALTTHHHAHQEAR